MYDSKTVFAEAQATSTITHDDAFPINDTFANALTATNIIDLGDTANSRDGGAKADVDPLLIDIFVTTQFVGASSLTYFLLKTCDTEGGTYTTLFVSKFFAPASLAPGKDPILTISVPGGTLGADRFLKLQVGCLTADVTAGAFSAAIRPAANV